MTVLVDSNILIDFWKRPTEELIRTLSDIDIAVCDVVAAELLHGAISEKNLQSMTKQLNSLEFLSLEENSWEALGSFLYQLRIHGVTVPFQDAVIALIAMQNRVPVFTNDEHYAMMKKVFPELQLYPE